MYSRIGLNELRDLCTSRSDALKMKNILHGLSLRIPTWDLYSEESKAEEVKKA